MPFTAATGAEPNYSAVSFGNVSFLTFVEVPVGTVGGGETVIYLREITSAGGGTALTNADMNLKLYAYNKLDWSEFQCYNWLIHKESRWNYKARNGSHYGLGQMRSKWYGTLDPYKQVKVHLKYVKHRYDGCACKAYQHWKDKGWH